MVNGKEVLVKPSIKDRRLVWTSSMRQAYPLLTDIAARLLSLHATSCASERNWSLWRFVSRDNRTRLQLSRVRFLSF